MASSNVSTVYRNDYSEPYVYQENSKGEPATKALETPSKNLRANCAIVVATIALMLSLVCLVWLVTGVINKGNDAEAGMQLYPSPAGSIGPEGPAGSSGPPSSPGLRRTAGPTRQPEPNPPTSGSLYIRWGRSDCPSTASLVYAGVVGGSHFTEDGGAANYLCLPLNPENLQVEAGTGGSRSFLYTTEYKISHFPPFNHLHQHDVPCAVCRVTSRSTLLMIPAKTTCPSDWTSEYKGYLMSAYHGHAHQTEYVCVDENAEARQGTSSNTNGALMYIVEATCGTDGLPCLPYVAGNELACVVCTI
ncbi:short-chain collagen C4-like [Amphiura filiformis]|uniref:short-chain collagen C4-like n=1 Tax=Amphiura filiformis TaxID=82378 RepID=UPI003B211CD6